MNAVVQFVGRKQSFSAISFVLFSDLEEKLKAADGARLKLIVTDGVFSMDGKVAPLK